MHTATPAHYSRTRPAPRPPGPARALSDLALAAGAEWVKLRSVHSTWWGLATALVLMVAVAPSAALTIATNMGHGTLPEARIPASETALYAALWAVQFAVVAVALPVITSEYSSGSIRPSLQAVSSRVRLLTAKALALAALVFASGLVMAAVGTLVTWAVSRHPLFEAQVTLDAGEAALDAVRAAVHLTAVALVTLGLGALLRSTAAALTCVFMLLMGLPVMLLLMGGDLGILLAGRLPFLAGVSLGDSPFLVGGFEHALPPAAGGAVLVCWALVCLGSGAVALVRRDA